MWIDPGFMALIKQGKTFVLLGALSRMILNHRKSTQDFTWYTPLWCILLHNTVLYPEHVLASRDAQISIWTQQSRTSASIWTHAKKGNWYANYKFCEYYRKSTIAVMIVRFVSSIVSRSPDFVPRVGRKARLCKDNATRKCVTCGVQNGIKLRMCSQHSSRIPWHRRRVSWLWGSV